VRVRDGKHRWQIVATDQRGQTAITKSAVLRIDDTPPSLHVMAHRSGNTVAVSAAAHDKRSGLKSIVTSFGDGTRRAGGHVSHRYRHSGSYDLVVRATDEAGARRTWSRVIRIKKQ
jgi:signal recognition particle GTPase